MIKKKKYTPDLPDEPADEDFVTPGHKPSKAFNEALKAVANMKASKGTTKK